MSRCTFRVTERQLSPPRCPTSRKSRCSCRTPRHRSRLRGSKQATGSRPRATRGSARFTSLHRGWGHIGRASQRLLPRPVPLARMTEFAGHENYIWSVQNSFSRCPIAAIAIIAMTATSTAASAIASLALRPLKSRWPHRGRRRRVAAFLIVGTMSGSDDILGIPALENVGAPSQPKACSMMTGASCRSAQ